MYCSPTYTLQILSGIPYLLPFGQGIADFHRQLRLEGSGAFLWGELLRAQNKAPDAFAEKTAAELAAMLCSAVMQKEESPEAERASILADTEQFVRTLIQYQVLCSGTLPRHGGTSSAGPSTPSVSPMPGAPSLRLSIGGIPLALYGGEELFSKELLSFQADPQTEQSGTPQLEIYFRRADGGASPDSPAPADSAGTSSEAPGTRPERILVDRPNLWISEGAEGYRIRYPESGRVRGVFLAADGTYAEFTLCGEADDAMRYDIFHAIRLVYSLLSGMRGRFLMHSASFLYRGKAWLFSGPSGTGKSTHVGLWRELCGSEIEDINGDLNLLSLERGNPERRNADGRQPAENRFLPTVHGIPWNGTSGIYRTGAFPLGGIVFLHQAPENRIENRTDAQNQLSVLQRLISPAWTEEQLVRNLEFAGKLVPEILVRNLYCTKDIRAAELMRAQIDAYLGGRAPEAAFS